MNFAIRGQDDSHGRPWRRWSQVWTSPIMIRAVSLTTFPFLCIHQCHLDAVTALIARFVGPTWGPSGADRTQVGPCWPHELCYLGVIMPKRRFDVIITCLLRFVFAGVVFGGLVVVNNDICTASERFMCLMKTNRINLFSRTGAYIKRPLYITRYIAFDDET